MVTEIPSYNDFSFYSHIRLFIKPNTYFTFLHEKVFQLDHIPFLILIALIQNRFLLAVVGFFVAGFGQCVKVSNDALVQSKISDIYRGRVFAFYDVVVNGAIVSGAVIAALMLPASGKSLSLPILIALIYAATNLFLLKRVNFSGHSNSTN